MTGTTLYTTLEARTQWLLPLLLAVLFGVGVALLRAGWQGRACLRYLSDRVAPPAQVLIGLAMMVAIPAWGVHARTEGVACRQAMSGGSAATVTGTLTIDRTVGRRFVEFGIDGRRFRTYTGLGSSDCGFVASLGERVHAADGQTVRAWVVGDVVLRLDRL